MLPFISASSRPLGARPAIVANSTTGRQAPGIPAAAVFTVFLTLAVEIESTPPALESGAVVGRRRR